MLTRLFLLFAVAFVGLASTPAFAQAKIGTVDLQRAMAEISEGKAGMARLDTMMRGKQAQIEQMETNIMALQEEYQAKESVLSDASRSDYQQRLQAMGAEYQQTVMRSEQEMQAAYVQVLEQLMPKIRAQAEALAGEQGMDMIIDVSQGGVVFSKAGVDVTDKLIARMNAGN